ncbi:MAG: PPC domain-containing protein [Geminicoccaceae bacterium]
MATDLRLERLAASAGAMEDVPGDSSTTVELTVEAPVEGTIDEAYDQDWYRFAGRSGATFDFRLDGPDGAYLSLFDAEGNWLDQSDDGHLTRTFTGDEVIHVAFGTTETATGDRYTLSATERPDDIPGSAATGAVLAAGGSATGTVDHDQDADWFRVEVSAGTSYVFDLQGSDSGAGSLADPWLRILDADGNEIRSDLDGGTGREARTGLTASVDGVIYLACAGGGWNDDGNWSPSTGTYRLGAATVAGDQPDNIATPATLGLGTTATASIDFPGDADWFRVETVAGRSYLFDLEGHDTGAGTLGDPYLRLLDAEGSEIAYDNNGGTGTDARLGFTAIGDGPVYVSAGGAWIEGADGPSTGTYRLGVREVVDDVAGNAATRATLETGGAVTGSIDWAGDNPDSDWFRLEVQAGHTYRIDLEGSATAVGTLADPLLSLFDASGGYIGYDEDSGSGTNALLGFTASADGIVFVQAVSEDVGSYRLAARELAGDVGDSAASAMALTAGSAATGIVDWSSARDEWADRDLFRVEVEAGKTYAFDLEGAATGAGTLVDPRLRLLDADGNELRNGESGGEGTNDRLGFTAAADGIAYLEASAGYAMDPDGDWVRLAGTYRLTSSILPDDPADNVGTAALLAIGSARVGTIDFPDDSDWYRVEVVAGRSYVFDLEGVDTGAGTLVDPRLSLRDADGNEIHTAGWASGDGNNDRLGFTAAEDGSVFVDARGWRSGIYRLGAVEAPEDVGDTAASAGLLPTGSVTSGRIDWVHDGDSFRIEVQAGRSYVIDLEGADSGAGTLADPFLRLLDADGNEIGSASGGGEGRNAQLGFTATTDGPVFVTASEELELAGSYRLSLRDMAEVADNTTTNASIAVGTSIAGTIDWTGDSDWFRFEVEAGRAYVLHVEGLSAAGGGFDFPVLNVYDADGTQVASDIDWYAGGDADVGLLPIANGPVFVGVSNLQGLGSYRLSARELVDDVPEGVETRAVVAPGDAVDVTIDHRDDSDWYRVELEAGKYYRFTMEDDGSTPTYRHQRSLELYDLEGNYIGSDIDDHWEGTYRDDLATDVFSAVEDSTILVATKSEEAGQYRLVVSELDADEPDGQSLTVGGSFAGEIGYPQDVDVYSLAAESGKSYVITLIGDNLGLAFNGAGQSGAEFGYNPTVGFTAVATGVLSVLIDGTYTPYDSDASYMATGGYQLTVREVVGDQAGDPTTEATLAAGSSVAGSIDWGGYDPANDRDWFRFEARAGQTYVFDLLGAADGGGTLTDPVLRLLDFEGNEIGTSAYSDANGHAQLTYRPEENGVLYLSAEGIANYGDPWSEHRVTGTYRLSATAVVDDVGDGPDTAGSIAAGSAVTGAIDWANTGSEDRDWYRLEVAAGQTYVVDLAGAGSGAGTLGDPRLTLHDADGNEIAADEDGGAGSDAQLGFTAGEDGVLFIAAGGDHYDAEGNWRPSSGTYRLEVREATDDIGAEVATAMPLAVGGSTTGTVDFGNDRDWFRVSVEAGRSYLFELEGAATGDGSLGGAVLELFYPGGSVLRHDEGGGVGGNARVSFTPTTDGELLLAAGGYGEANLGSYRLTAREDPGGLWGDLPAVRERVTLPDAAIQAVDDNAPAAGGEVFLTWLGGVARFDDAVGVCRIGEDGSLAPEIVFASGHDAEAGDAVSLGSVHVEDRLGLFAIADGARQVPGLASLGPDDLALRNPATGEPATAGDSRPPELVRLDGPAPETIAADLVFAFDQDPSTPLANPLNPGGLAQATVGSFWRDGLEVCRVVAFEDLVEGRPHRDGDFNDAVVALSVGRLDDTDLTAIRAWLFG